MTIRKLDDLGKNDVLPICCSNGCAMIRIDDEANRWIVREDNSNLYDEYLQAYKGRLSHTYCNPCENKLMQSLE